MNARSAHATHRAFTHERIRHRRRPNPVQARRAVRAFRAKEGPYPSALRCSTANRRQDRAALAGSGRHENLLYPLRRAQEFCLSEKGGRPTLGLGGWARLIGWCYTSANGSAYRNVPVNRVGQPDSART